jgi:cell division protein FtsN
MLRWAVALLLLANGLYFAWMQGLLAAFGWPPPADPREPQRLERQIAPERVRLLNGPQGAEAPREAAAPPAQAPAPTPAPSATDTPAAPAPAPESHAQNAADARICWQAAGFSPEQAELLRAELRLLGLAGDSWQLSEQRSTGRWIVYMGRYENAEQVARKKAELRELGVEFRDVNTNGLAPGLAVGTFSSEEAAREGLQLAERRNVRSARVVQERAEGLSFTLRLPAATEEMRSRIQAIGPAMAGRRLQRCG